MVSPSSPDLNKCYQLAPASLVSKSLLISNKSSADERSRTYVCPFGCLVESTLEP